jgi:hypothetical protein
MLTASTYKSRSAPPSFHVIDASINATEAYLGAFQDVANAKKVFNVVSILPNEFMKIVASIYTSGKHYLHSISVM